MAGPNNTDDDRGDGRAGSIVSGSLKDRMILSMGMVILGGIGASGYITINDPRPNPWTSLQAKEAHEDIEKTLKDEIARLENRIEVCYSRHQAHEAKPAHQAADVRLNSHEHQIRKLWERVQE